MSSFSPSGPGSFTGPTGPNQLYDPTLSEHQYNSLRFKLMSLIAGFPDARVCVTLADKKLDGSPRSTMAVRDVSYENGQIVLSTRGAL